MSTVAGETTVFKVGTTSTTTTVINVQSITLGAVEQTPIDDWGLGSTAKTQRPSKIPDYGTLKVEFYFDYADTQHQLIRTSASNGATLYYTVDYPGGGKSEGTCFVTSLEWGGMEKDSNLTATVEFKVNTLTHTDS